MNVFRTNAVSRARDERGMIAAWFAILCMLVFFGFSFFVVNLSNTHEHQRHLQVQVDDGALAAGSAFTGCFQAAANANANIAREARRFSGDPTYPTNYYAGGVYDTTQFPGPYNQQVENATRVAIGLNKGTFPPYAAPITEFDPTFDLRPDLTGIQNLPCDSDILDVKATDVGVPTPFGGLVPGTSSTVNVRARARVEIKKVQILSGFLPWAVPEVRPKAVVAIFVDEGSGTVRGAQLLTDSGTTSTLNGTGVELWSAAAQYTGQGQSGTGVIVGVSGVANPSTSGTLAQICAQAKMKCYSGSSATSGLWYIQGFPNGNGAIAAAPLKPGNVEKPACGGNAAPLFSLNGNCTAVVSAHIGFGVAGDPRPFPNCATATVNGSAMTWQSGDLWTGTVTIPDALGRYNVTISWASGHRANQNNCNNQINGGTFPTNAAAPYAADDASGPVEYVSVTDPNTGVLVGSLGTSNNSPQSVFVKVGLQPPLHVATSASEPPILLRFASGHGSRTQALDCDHAPQVLEDEVREGCHTQYAVNTRGETCVGPPGPTYTQANLPPALPPPQPNPAPDCIQWKTGQVTAMAKGLHARFEAPFAAGCSPNLWATFRANGQLPPTTDPRWVSLVVADATQFVGNGAGVIPIRVFAGFYVTGWFVTGNGPGTQGCTDAQVAPNKGNDPHPLGYAADSKKASGDVWGYFVTDVILGSTGQSNEFCQFNEIGLCFAALTQ